MVRSRTLPVDDQRRVGAQGQQVARLDEAADPRHLAFHGYAEDWRADNPDLTRELANRCG